MDKKDKSIVMEGAKVCSIHLEILSFIAAKYGYNDVSKMFDRALEIVQECRKELNENG